MYREIGGVMGFYATATEQRAKTLQDFQSEARTADLRDDATFQRVFVDGQALLELSDQEIADGLSVSRPTVNRWTNGRNLPHNAMRKPILTWIEQQLAAKIKKLKASARQVSASYSASGYSVARTAGIAAKSRS